MSGDLLSSQDLDFGRRARENQQRLNADLQASYDYIICWLPHEQPSAVSAAIYGWLAVRAPSYLPAGGDTR